MKNYLKEYIVIMTLLLLTTILFVVQQKVETSIIAYLLVAMVVVLAGVTDLTIDNKDRYNIFIIKRILIEITFWLLIASLIYLTTLYFNNYDIILKIWYLPSLWVNLIVLRFWVKLYKR